MSGLGSCDDCDRLATDWPLDFEFAVDGVSVKLSLTYESARKIHEDWSPSVTLLNLGSEAPLLRAGLAKIFAS